MSSLKTTETDTKVSVMGKDFKLNFDKTRGSVTSLNFEGTELVSGELAPNFWRAPTNNDKGNGAPTRTPTWRNAGQNRTIKTVVLTKLNDKAVRIDVMATLPTTVESLYKYSYTIYGSGQIYLDGVKAFDSGTMTKDTPAKLVNLDVTGKSELKLVVSDGGSGDISEDHGDWADAKLLSKTLEGQQ